MSTPAYDLVIFGATGFVGKLICRYLASNTFNDVPVRWAICGRNQAKLDALLKDLPGTAPAVMVADAKDPASLEKLCAQTKVVISTVGPYNRYGEPLIAQCAKSGTDYVDLCGEVLWLKEMIDRYQAQAQQSGARLCPTAGFDSVPSDLGTWWLQQESHAMYGAYCNRVKLRVIGMQGGLSGGTLASMTDTSAAAAADSSVRKALLDPYLITTPYPQSPPRQTMHTRPFKEREFEGWMAPFFMEAINSRVVHRSHSLIDFAYGPDFRYDEAMLAGQGGKGWLMGQAISVGIAGAFVAASIAPVRKALHRVVLPKPGQGPSEKMQREGFFNIELWGSVDEHRSVRVRLSAFEDPGYAATAKILSQAGLCLAFDQSLSDVPGGFWTPATALKEPFRQRLIRYAGLKFERLYPSAADEPAQSGA